MCVWVFICCVYGFFSTSSFIAWLSLLVTFYMKMLLELLLLVLLLLLRSLKNNKRTKATRKEEVKKKIKEVSIKQIQYTEISEHHIRIPRFTGAHTHARRESTRCDSWERCNGIFTLKITSQTILQVNEEENKHWKRKNDTPAWIFYVYILL